MKSVHYQKDEMDGYTHYYHYDQLNRLKEVQTTTDKDVHRATEAVYQYYDYGPLARVEIGEHQVQGIDYAYTINGWIKGVNSNTLVRSRDMGMDGTTGYDPQNTSVHRSFAKDVFGFTLSYFDGDYTSIGASSFEATHSSTNFGNGSADLYNGNIRHMVTAIQGLDIQGYAYSYDQLQRLKEMRVYRDLTSDLVTSNTWGSATATDNYLTQISYDKNGNISYLKRNGFGSGTDLDMDEFTYNYYNQADNNSGTSNDYLSNRLNYVSDTVTGSVYDDDIKHGQTEGNYKYNKIGELIEDEQEAMILEWRSDHKLKSVTRTNNDSPNVDYIYDPLGTRVAKIVKPRSGGVLSSQEDWLVYYYAYNGQGQLMAVYESKLYYETGETTLNEQYMYGSSKLGHIRQHKTVYFDGLELEFASNYQTNTLGKKRYEMQSYNDNVLAVITDRKTYNATDHHYEAVVVQQTDYYAFGMMMPGRSIYTDLNRFGYHGMETDPEHKGDGNHYTTYFRQYDPRLGRWMSLDPESAMFPHESNYAANHNNPVMFVDQPGDFPVAAVFAGFAIGMGFDFTMQFIKGTIGGLRKGYGWKKSFGESFKNIDLADVFISGLVGGALPAFGIYRYGLDPILKNIRKRIIKYSGKILMNMIDFRIIREGKDNKLRITMSITFMKWGWGTKNDVGDSDMKKSNDRWRDRVFTLLGIALQELDFATEIFSSWNYGVGLEFSDGNFQEGWVKGFRGDNQLSIFTAQQVSEGTLKGGLYPKGKYWNWSDELAHFSKMTELNFQLLKINIKLISKDVFVGNRGSIESSVDSIKTSGPGSGMGSVHFGDLKTNALEVEIKPTNSE